MVPGTCWPITVLTSYGIFSAGTSAAIAFTPFFFCLTDIVPGNSAAMNLALAMLPWKLIWGLNMRKQERIGVAVTMSCGVLYVPCLPYPATYPGELCASQRLQGGRYCR